MAAPSSTVPVAAAATGASPTDDDVGFLKYVQEIMSGTATFMQEMPAGVGPLCKTFLAFEQLVETAKSNKEALSTLRDLCDVVIKGVLDKRSARSGLTKEGFAKLKEHVDKADEVAKLCNGVGTKKSWKRFLLTRKISKDIAAVRIDVLAFCSANTLVLGDDTNVSKCLSWAVLGVFNPPSLSLSLFLPARSLPLFFFKLNLLL